MHSDFSLKKKGMKYRSAVARLFRLKENRPPVVGIYQVLSVVPLIKSEHYVSFRRKYQKYYEAYFRCNSYNIVLFKSNICSQSKVTVLILTVH